MGLGKSMGVIHGRFQVLHNDHLVYLSEGKRRCRHLVIGITNPDPVLTKEEASDPARSDLASNPLTFFERHIMIREGLVASGMRLAEFSIVPFPINLPELYRFYLPMEARFFLSIYDDWGRAKRERFLQLGLDVEVLWERPQSQKGVSASQVRSLMKRGEPWRHLVPESTWRLMQEWEIPKRLGWKG